MAHALVCLVAPAILTHYPAKLTNHCSMAVVRVTWSNATHRQTVQGAVNALIICAQERRIAQAKTMSPIVRAILKKTRIRLNLSPSVWDAQSCSSACSQSAAKEYAEVHGTRQTTTNFKASRWINEIFLLATEKESSLEKSCQRVRSQTCPVRLSSRVCQVIWPKVWPMSLMQSLPRQFVHKAKMIQPAISHSLSSQSRATKKSELCF